MSTLRQKFEELSRTYPPQMRPSLVLPLLQHLQEEKGFPHAAKMRWPSPTAPECRPCRHSKS